MRTDSPEDRLLHLIKGKYKKKADTGGTLPAEKKKPFFKDAAKSMLLGNRMITANSVRTLSRILMAVLVLSIIYLINSFIYNPYKEASSVLMEKVTIPTGEGGYSAEKPASPVMESYSSYSSHIQGRELFSSPAVSANREESKVPAIDVAKRFTLVGIIAGAEPQAIIEDKETEKTFYLYQGQEFSGVVLEEIGNGKVVLNYQGEKTILVL